MMAQVFIPDNPREREQLYGAVTTHEVSYATTRRSRIARRFGAVDLLIVLALLAAFAFLITAAARWTAPLTPSITIDLSPAVLPLLTAEEVESRVCDYFGCQVVDHLAQKVS